MHCQMHEHHHENFSMGMPLDGCPSNNIENQNKKHASSPCTNILGGDLCITASTDPKTRLRWTPELHDRFVDAITQLGGPDSKLCLLLLIHLFRIICNCN